MTNDSKPTEQEIRDTVHGVLAEFSKRDKHSINSGDRIADVLNIDSLQFIEVVQAIENKFKLKLSDEKLAHVQTVNDLVVVSLAAEPPYKPG